MKTCGGSFYNSSLHTADSSYAVIDNWYLQNQNGSMWLWHGREGYWNSDIGGCGRCGSKPPAALEFLRRMGG